MDLKTAEKEYTQLLEQLTDPELVSNWEKLEELSKKKKRLERFIAIQKEIDEVAKHIAENKAIINAQEDRELMSLAETEFSQLQARETSLRKELDALLRGEGSTPSPAAVIIEIRAGTGGEEAALFVASLYKMYFRYADGQGWDQKLLDSHPTELGGFKEVVFTLKGTEVFEKMQFEGGVHRVQRIPETEKQGRVHTSTVSVAVLPKPKKTDIVIKPDELKTDFYRASGPGGQYVNKRESAVRITHLPSGLVVTSQAERNQLQNKENALAILAARLKEKQAEEQHESAAGKRKEQIGRAKRSEKIRTYNFPQDRVTDHRIKKTWHNIEEIMQGKLEQIIETLKASI